MNKIRGIRYLTWAWLLLIGPLLITPEGIWCIQCGVPIDVPGYIGNPAVAFLGIGAIVLGVVGLTTEFLGVTMGKSINKEVEPTQV